MKKSSRSSRKRILALVLTCVMVLSMLPGTAFAAKADTRDTPVAEVPAASVEAARTAELPAQPLETTADRTTPQTYYVSTSGNGGNDGLSEANPLPGLDAVPWDQLIAGDNVLLKKGDTFPGAIRMVGVHGTENSRITIGVYGNSADAPVIEARGQGIWLPKTGNDNGGTPGKYVSSGITLYDCSYVSVSGLTIVNVPDTMKSSFTCADGTDRSGDKMTYSGVGVAATDAGACEGIQLTDITVRGNSELVAVKTDTSTTISTTGVTTGATATARTYTNASGTYYVSSKSGNDSNNGTSEATPFYSLHKINELNLQPGAKVYLERGSVFENQYLHIEGGGNEAAPIIIDAYGTGDAPVINTNGNGVWYQNYRNNLDNAGHLVHGYVSSSVLLYDVPYVEVKNIAMTNFGRYGETEGADFDYLRSYDGGTVPGETGYAGSGNGAGNKVGCYQWGGKMTRTGVAAVAQDKGTVTHTVLQNLDIENIYGNIVYKHMNNGGIYFTVARPLNEAATGIARFDDVRIEGCYLKRVSRWGIAVAHTAYWRELSPNGQQAIPDARCQQYGATNVYIGHNYLEEVGGDPITAMHAYEPFVEYNVAYNGGREMCGSSTGPRYINGTYFAGNSGDVSAGIWPWKCKTALFEHNECYTMLYSHLGGNNDAQPWDADSGDSTIYQYNYSSGNTGGCIMLCGGDAYNTVFRYNISYKDGKPWAESNPQNNSTRRGILDPSSCPNGQIYNNTFVVAEGTPVYHYTTGSPVKVENNIFYNLGNEYAPQGGWNAASGPRFVKNIYVGFAQSGEGSYTAKDSSPVTLDKTALFADTNFTNAPEAPKTTEKTGARTTADGVRDWTHDWATEFNMFKLKDGATDAVNAGLPHNYDCLNQDSDFGVPRVANTKDFYGNALDNFHDIGAFDSGTADPEGVTVSAVSYDRATIQWSAVAGAASYKVALDDGEPVAAETLSHHTCSNLFPLAEYTVSVTAYDANGQALGAARTATFTTTRPAAPTNPDAIRPIAVKAGSEQTGSEGKENAIDGNSNSIWHTNWNGSNAADRWIAVDLGRVQAINNFKYLPRQDSGDGGVNGIITAYEIYLSSTEADWETPGVAGSWTKVKEGTWEQDRVWKTVEFDANTTARYVKLKCVTGVNNHASAAEIAVNGTPCTSVTLADATVAVNKTVRVEVTTTPAGSAANNLVWTSSNRKVATVDSNGVVTGLSEGTTTITAHLLNDTTATCTVTVTPRELSDACALVSSVFEVRDAEIMVPFTEKNPTTVAEVAAGLTVSEAATVKVLSGETEQADTANVAAGMTVRIVAENGTSHTDYTVVQKNVYNSYADWVNQAQGNVWFYQYQENGEFVDHTSWDGTYFCWADNSKGYISVERNQACGSITAENGSGFTFRAPIDGIVTVNLNNYQSGSLAENQVKKREATTNSSMSHYIRIYRNGVELSGKEIALEKSTNAVTVAPITISLAQGDTLEIMARNEGAFTNKGGNHSVYFNPMVTYLNEVYKPEATSVTLNETAATLGIGETVQLTATVLPEEADQTVTWESTHPEYAVVDANGLVTAVGNGTTAVIATATTSWGKEITASCEVTVATKVTGITVKKDGNPVGNTPVKIYANEGDQAHSNVVTLTATVEPTNASNKTLNWTRPEGARGLISVEREGTGASAVITAVAGGANVGEVMVEVASAADPDVTTTFKVQVFRYLVNDVIITGDAKVGETLTVNLNQLVMTDAGKEALTFQWKRDSEAIDGADEKTYTLTAEDYNTTISVDVIPSAATFYEGTRTATIAGKVAKQDGPAAPEGLTAVQCTSGNDGKITGLDSTKAYEYSANGTDWTSAGENATEITGLAAGTYLIRFAATDTQEAGAAVTKTVLAADATGFDISFHINPAEGGVIDVDKNPAEERDTVTITATAKPGYTLVADSLSVTHTEDDQQKVTVTEQNTFEMPAADVTISATFKKLTVKLTHELTNIDCDQVEHDHTVEYGDKPVIHLVAQEGYTMPNSVTIVKTGTDEVFSGYTYSHKAATPDEATITFDQGITEALTIRGAGAEKFYTVNYTLTNGLTAPEAGASRTVKHKAAYTGTLVAEHPEQYKLPLGIQITMGGAAFTDFTYNSETGLISIAAEKITGNLIVTAEGLDATVPVHPVTGVTLDRTSASVQIGKTVTLTATVQPDNATEKSVIWQSSDETIATVDGGVVTGVAEGTATITVTTVDGNRTASCTVTVTKATSPSRPSTGGSTSSGSSTTTETREDGTKVTTETKPDGSKTQTVEQADGTKSEMEVTKDGDVTITVTDPEGEELVKTEIPAEIPEPETKFEDVTEAAPWAEEAIDKMAGLKLVEGTGDNKYSPVAPMTRGSLATVLHRLSQGKTDYEVTFKDVAQGKYYTEGVAWAAKANVVKGISEDVFAPDKVITREQLAVMLCRYAKLVGLNTKADAKALEAFTDGDTTGAWAVDGMAWCVENGILKGKGQNNLDPTADVTRAEVAVMLDRFIALLK